MKAASSSPEELRRLLSKLGDHRTELKSKQAAAESERRTHVVAATSGNAAARTIVDRASATMAELERQASDIDLAINETEAALTEANARAERDARQAELAALKEMMAERLRLLEAADATLRLAAGHLNRAVDLGEAITRDGNRLDRDRHRPGAASYRGEDWLRDQFAGRATLFLSHLGLGNIIEPAFFGHPTMKVPSLIEAERQAQARFLRDRPDLNVI
jgi:hypothetical protein